MCDERWKRSSEILSLNQLAAVKPRLHRGLRGFFFDVGKNNVTLFFLILYLCICIYLDIYNCKFIIQIDNAKKLSIKRIMSIQSCFINDFNNKYIAGLY